MGLAITVVLMIVASVMAQAGMFYQTGQQWFEACWLATHAKREPANAAESIAWKQCSPLVEKAVFEAGFIFAGEPVYTPSSKAIAKNCPSNWYDLPLGGVHVLAVRLAEEGGGPTLMDRFLPSETMVARVFDTKWPMCVRTRKAEGFPRLVKRGETWGFETPCKPCELEDAERLRQR